MEKNTFAGIKVVAQKENKRRLRTYDDIINDIHSIYDVVFMGKDAWLPTCRIGKQKNTKKEEKNGILNRNTLETQNS